MLDTDICSYIMKRSSEPVLKRLRRTPVDAICISVISKAELLFGAELSLRREQNEAAPAGFLRHVEVLDVPDEAAIYYAQIRAALNKRGGMIRANDLLTAAHALSRGLILVTNNIREFRRVHGLALENWTLRN